MKYRDQLRQFEADHRPRLQMKSLSSLFSFHVMEKLEPPLSVMRT